MSGQPFRRALIVKRHELIERRHAARVESCCQMRALHHDLVADGAAKLPNFAPMGRIFEVRKHTMFARWDRMAKQFSRISKEIIVAVKAGGADPHSNPALRRAVQNARQINMPK